MNRPAAILALLGGLSGAVAGGQVPRYTITDIGAALGGGDSYATAINSSGQVVGSYRRAAAGGLLPVGSSAFLYSGGSTYDLGSLPAGAGGCTDTNHANAINNSGQTVGLAGTSGPTDLTGASAFLYSGGTMQSLGLLPGYPAGGYTGIFGPSTAATGINDSGQIVGSAFFVTGGILTYPPPPAPHAFLYSGAVMQDLGTFPGGSQSEATGINDSGQVVGYADNSSGSEHAFLVSGGTMRDLGTLPGGSNSYATAINNSGQVVGYGDGSDGNQHAFLYSGGAMQELTFPGAWETLALGINNRGQVVGEAHIAGANMGAFLYSNGAMVDLNSVTAARGWILEQATGINDSGEIVGYGVNPSGQTDAFLLTPTPEPSTLCLSITCGFALLASHLRCRRTPTLSANGGPRWRFGLVSQRETD